MEDRLFRTLWHLSLADGLLGAGHSSHRPGSRPLRRPESDPSCRSAESLAVGRRHRQVSAGDNQVAGTDVVDPHCKPSAF